MSNRHQGISLTYLTLLIAVFLMLIIAGASPAFADHSVDKLPISGGPAIMRINPETNTIYAALYDLNKVIAIDGKTNNVTSSISLIYPYDMVVNLSTNKPSNNIVVTFRLCGYSYQYLSIGNCKRKDMSLTKQMQQDWEETRLFEREITKKLFDQTNSGGEIELLVEMLCMSQRYREILESKVTQF